MKLISVAVRSFVSLTIISGAIAIATSQEKQKTTPSPSPSPMLNQKTTETPAASAANPADVKSIDAIIAAVYDVISGPAGKKRDWDRMRSLFLPGARLIPTAARQTGGYGSRVLTIDEYVERASGFFEKEGFYEQEVARKTEQFGQIAHAFSTYESRHAPGDAKPFQRGINSIQLMNDGKRWWVTTIFWQGEDEKNPLPEKYLKK
ncbi:MAG: hypothetical protein M3R67_13580 [Acidobacteriota bacterium]|nr:hypothetical protein [Acidobacteriota bacterium]